MALRFGYEPGHTSPHKKDRNFLDSGDLVVCMNDHEWFGPSSTPKKDVGYSVRYSEYKNGELFLKLDGFQDYYAAVHFRKLGEPYVSQVGDTFKGHFQTNNMYGMSTEDKRIHFEIELRKRKSEFDREQNKLKLEIELKKIEAEKRILKFRKALENKKRNTIYDHQYKLTKHRENYYNLGKNKYDKLTGKYTGYKIADQLIETKNKRNKKNRKSFKKRKGLLSRFVQKLIVGLNKLT